MIRDIDQLAEFMRLAGAKVIDIDGVYWYEYSGFMIPAYLPHCTPQISSLSAKKVVKATGYPFVRWTSNFGTTEDNEWWHVIHEGPYSIEQCKSKTRWQINKGKKTLLARRLIAEEVLDSGYDVCKRAVERFDDRSFLPTEAKFKQRVRAAVHVPGVMEYFGVFSGEKLVALAENIVQYNAVFWETIWYDPEFIGNHSSYVLTDFMLNHYLNERKFNYVSDGNRSIYHQTNVQEHYISKFNFKKKYAVLNVEYNSLLKFIIFLFYPAKNIFFYLNEKLGVGYLKKISGLLIQEEIHRSRKKSKRE